MIQSRRRYSQFIDFSGLVFGSIHPTDSDMEIEYHNKAWIFVEIKYNRKELTGGQKIAFERKINDLASIGKQVVLFVADHFVSDVETDVDAASCPVRKFYWQGKWYKGDGSDLKSYINRFIGMVDGLAA